MAIKHCMQNGSRQNLPGLFCWTPLSWLSHCSSKTPSSCTSHSHMAPVCAAQTVRKDPTALPRRTTFAPRTQATHAFARRRFCRSRHATPQPPPHNPRHVNLESAQLQPATPLRRQDTGLPLPSAQSHHSPMQPRSPTRNYPCQAAHADPSSGHTRPLQQPFTDRAHPRSEGAPHSNGPAEAQQAEAATARPNQGPNRARPHPAAQKS